MFNLIGHSYSIDKKVLEKVSRAAFKYLGQDFEVNLKFVSPEKIKELNRIYRHKSEVTDVLSFTSDSKAPGGDIVICRSEAKKQAGILDSDVNSHVALLSVHGILHLAGYEHTKKKDRVKMEKAEEKILSKIL